MNLWNWNKPAENDKDADFKLSEEMLIKDIPDSILTKFVETNSLLKENQDLIKIIDENTKKKKEEKEAKNKLKNINSEIIYELNYNLSSLAHQIDTGSKTLKEYQKELGESKNDINNVNAIKSYPTPFLIRYSKQIEDQAALISDGIDSYRSHLQSISTDLDEDNSTNKNKEDILYNFLYEEYQALLRLSSNISHLLKKLANTRNKLCQKLNISQLDLIDETESSNDSVFASIENKYKQFKEARKSKLKKSYDETDLFGRATKIEPVSNTFNNYSSGSFIASRREKNPTFSPNLKVYTNTDNSASFPKPKSNAPPPAPTTKDAGKNPFK